jgi:hypothetical protein
MTNYFYVDSITGYFLDLEVDVPLDPIPDGWTLVNIQTYPDDATISWDFVNLIWYWSSASLNAKALALQLNDDTEGVFVYNETNYNVSDFQQFPWNDISIQAIRENKTDSRNVVFSDGSSSSLTNGEVVELFEAFSNYIQATRDICAGAITQISNLTIQTPDDLNSYWTSARSGYVNTRTVATDNEDLQNNKVDKVEGKELSANDFTDTYKAYLDRTVHTSTSVTIVTSTSAGGHVLSSTKIVDVAYFIDLSCTSTIGGASSASVLLEICATNSTTAGDWIEYGRISIEQTITLALALQSIHTSTQNLVITDIPAGYYVRLRSIISGTGSASLRSSREKY